MELTKPQRRTNIFDYWNVSKKIKLIDETKISTRKSITRFEDFSNELFYEIFSFLDVYDVYKAFYGLNIRLQSLLTHSTLPLKINISSMSRSNFQSYHRHMIMSNKHRITSLSLSNPFIVDLIFSPVRITSNFIRLETLIFDNIKSKYLLNILNHLISLSNLSSLVIIPIDHVQNSNDLYQHIFRLPTLKYCKVLLQQRFKYQPLPMAIDAISPIEHLVINNDFAINHLNPLLSYIPHLRRLCIDYLDISSDFQPELYSSKLNNLTHVCLNKLTITFNQFELMSRNLFNQLEILRISTSYDRECLNANRWEKLILSSMPKLRIFDFQYTDFLDNEDDNNQLIYDSVINQFSSSFWFERKWSFAYQFYLGEYRNQVIFYSINPYRKKQYTLYKQLITSIHSRRQRRNMDFVDHVNIRSEETMISCNHYFRNATKLTLSNNFDINRVWLGVILKRLIPLKHLTTLVIDCTNFSFDQLIKLLNSTSNIHTLQLHCQAIKETDLMSIQQSEMFRLVSNTNIITNVTIKERYSSENIKFVVALCPRMQYLTIDVHTQYFESSVRFILSKSKSTIQQLCLLCIKNASKSITGTLKTLIESEELLDNYLFKLIGSELYFWW